MRRLGYGNDLGGLNGLGDPDGLKGYYKQGGDKVCELLTQVSKWNRRREWDHTFCRWAWHPSLWPLVAPVRNGRPEDIRNVGSPKKRGIGYFRQISIVDEPLCMRSGGT